MLLEVNEESKEEHDPSVKAPPERKIRHKATAQTQKINLNDNLNSALPWINPFGELQSQSNSKKSSGTPNFRKAYTKKLDFSDKMLWYKLEPIDYVNPSRYLYEFFTSKNYSKFHEKFIKFKSEGSINKDSEISKPFSWFAWTRKYLFIEPEGTILLITRKKHKKLLEFSRLTKNQTEIFVYLRPFAKWLLRTLSKRYKVYLYTELNSGMAQHVIDVFKENGIFFEGAYSNVCDDTKNMAKFFFENPEIDPNQSVLIDYDAKVLAVSFSSTSFVFYNNLMLGIDPRRNKLHSLISV